MSIAKHHAEWLSLIEVSGPFLSLPVLVQRFPQGMAEHDAQHAKALRQVHEEWDQDQNGSRPDRAIHRQWIDWVLRNTLDLGEVLVEGQDIPQTLKADLLEHGETLRPDKVVMEPDGSRVRLLIQTYPLTQKLGRVVEGRPWAASPDTRMMQLLHDTGVRLGLVTNGDQWMLVDAPKGETTGYASWFAPLWLEEPKTLQAFRTLLDSYRFFGVSEEETLERLLAQSAQDQQEVTDQLGYQVRRAVEVLVSSIDKANRDSGGALLRGVPEAVLYEAALTVMMRLVFLFCAEERDLLLLGDELYDKNYAVSTLREQLRGTATDFGEEVLQRRNDAWSRLLTTFRAVYGGVRHDRLKIPAYKGKLFDPDRFPFLEGRQAKTSWTDTASQPLPVDNRTVLHLLEALQVLQVKLPGGGPATPRKLSFRALQITQIGHVYEGLLDHTAVRASEVVLGLSGTRDAEPEVPLAQLEALMAKGEDALLQFLKGETGRSSVATIKKLLALKLDDQTLSRLRTACESEPGLWERVKPFAGLIRLDTFDYPVVVLPGGVYVTGGTDRRSSGTHYTPESLTKPVVRYTFEPMVYRGPSEGLSKNEWELHSPERILDLKVCDLACGSGAFLVAATEYLAERLMEAWDKLENLSKSLRETDADHSNGLRVTPYGQLAVGALSEEAIPTESIKRRILARRLIAQRCIYGVDKNPIAIEMAKLSLWILTMDKEKPFTFLDHAIRCGDSLVGVNVAQLKTFSLDGAGVGVELTGLLDMIPKVLGVVRQQRQALARIDGYSASRFEAKERLFGHVLANTQRLNYAADRLLAASWIATKPKDRLATLRQTLQEVDDRIRDVDPTELEAEGRAYREKVGCPQPFHWALEFPEVFMDRDGFDAFVGNPPFMGGQKITGFLGPTYRDYLVRELAKGKRGSADLCAYFFLRAAQLIRPAAGFGLIASNSIAQGDTREVGLDLLLAADYVVNRAGSSQPWPGLANLEISIVWVRRGPWNGIYVLDEKPTSGVTAFLAEPGTSTGLPYRLLANSGKSFQGSIVLGMGFVMEPEKAQELTAKDPRNKDVLFPYLNGDDLNSRPDQSPSRWVINFFDWPLSRDMAPNGYNGPVAADFPDCLAIVEEKVKPERMALRETADGKRLKAGWWLFCRNRPELYKTLNVMERALVTTRHSKYLAFSVRPTTIVASEATVVIAETDGPLLVQLQCSVHEAWTLTYQSNLETRGRYTPSDCFETYPFLESCHSSTVKIGENYNALRCQIMHSRSEGLTEVYNRFHDMYDLATDIKKLRDIHVDMDRAVADGYGWSDLELGHSFHDTKQGNRFTISESARREILARLLKLNHKRYAEEVAQGLHDKKKPKAAKSSRKSKGKASSEPDLFGEED